MLRTFYVKGIQHGITRKSPVISPQMFVEFFFFFKLENLGSLSKKMHIEFDLDKLQKISNKIHVIFLVLI